jgi:hypothetical protein
LRLKVPGSRRAWEKMCWLRRLSMRTMRKSKRTLFKQGP